MAEEYVYKSDFEKAYERYEKAFGEEYPYEYLNLTFSEATADIYRRIKSKIPVPESDYEHVRDQITQAVEKRRRELDDVRERMAKLTRSKE